MKTYPLIIPTMNRYTKFVNLIESLEKNGWANRVSVYVSVDYPAKDEYRDGWQRITEYLKSNSQRLNDVFASFTAFYQENTLGALQNANFLRKVVSPDFDNYILSEDDNLFSSDALEFICRGIEKYRDNPNVYGVCGANRNRNWEGDSAVCLPFLNMYGIGRWFEKFDDAVSWINSDNLEKLYYDDAFMNRVYISNPYIYHSLVLTIYSLKYNVESASVTDGTIKPIDEMQSVYMLYNDMTCVFPTTSMVKNDGYDGSGINCNNNDFWGFGDISCLGKIEDGFELPDNVTATCNNVALNYDIPTLRSSKNAKIIRFFLNKTKIKLSRKRLDAIYFVGDISWKLTKFFDKRYIKMIKSQK